MEGYSVEELLVKVEWDEVEKLQCIMVYKELELEFDLGNLLVMDWNFLMVVWSVGFMLEVDLWVLVWDNMQLFINQLWQLFIECVEEVLVVWLLEFIICLLCEKLVFWLWLFICWQQFVCFKGICFKKKINLVWDEVSGQWWCCWGYQCVCDDIKEWLIEVFGGVDFMEDQFVKWIQVKKEWVVKNELNWLCNLVCVYKMQLFSVVGMYFIGY